MSENNTAKGGFKNLKLSNKFLIALSVFIIGMAIIGFTFNSALTIGRVAINDTQKLGEFAEKITKIQVDLLEARRFEKDFRLNNDLMDLEHFETSMQSAREGIAAASLQLRTDQEKQLLTELQGIVDEYQNKFFVAVEAQVEVGLDVDSGLQGSLNEAATDLQLSLKKLNSRSLDNSFLTMRHWEDNALKYGDASYVQNMANENRHFIALLKAFKESSSRKKTTALLNDYNGLFLELVNANKHKIGLFSELQVIANSVAPEMTRLLEAKNKKQVENAAQFNAAESKITTNFLIAVIAIPLLVMILLFIVGRGVLKSISHLVNTVHKISAGDFEARAEIDSQDEIGELANSFNTLLDERVATLAKSEKEHKQLNHSIIELLKAVGGLSQKDLTVKVPVSEDVTGAVSDGLNLLTTEISDVLKEVNTISARVNKAANEVKTQADTVMTFARSGGEEINATLKELDNSVNATNEIAEISQLTNKASEKAMQTTETALHTVTNTVDSINQIRDIIRETEKRIKRLGERSQEISGVVGIINEIAERTHVLALNAGMQAASAGEAGRGFMVVANEVQRLAESSREATGQISTLVKNIQVDTSDTVNTMNNVITQVVEGTRLAQEAGERMQESRESTEELVSQVQRIAESTLAQVKVGEQLRQRAEKIQQTTLKTHEQLDAQNKLSAGLVNDAEELVTSVSVFKLPA